MSITRTPCAKQRHTGIALFVSLLILLLVSLMALLLSGGAIQQKKDAEKAQRAELARVATDSALNEAQLKIAQIANEHGAAQVCAHLECVTVGAPADARDFLQFAMLKSEATSMGTGTQPGRNGSLGTIPVLYAIDDLGRTPPSMSSTSASGHVRLFRIVACAVDAAGTCVQMVEDVYPVVESGIRVQ